MNGYTVLGEKLRELRETKLMTLTELARRSGVSYSYLKYVETEGRQPSGIIVHKIAAGLGVSINEFTKRTCRKATASR